MASLEERVKTMQKNFPWAYKRNLPMIVGCDLDAVLSASFLHHLLGWEIVGFYNCRDIYIDSSRRDGLVSALDQDLGNDLVFVDLDISVNNLNSIGHHILKLRPDDKLEDIGHKNSLNQSSRQCFA